MINVNGNNIQDNTHPRGDFPSTVCSWLVTKFSLHTCPLPPLLWHIPTTPKLIWVPYWTLPVWGKMTELKLKLAAIWGVSSHSLPPNYPSPKCSHFFQLSFPLMSPSLPETHKMASPIGFFTFTNNESRGQSQFVSQHFVLRQPPPWPPPATILPWSCQSKLSLFPGASLPWGLFL